MSSRPHHAAVSARRLAGLGLLVLALLWAQLLGLAHGVRHALPAGHAEAVSAVAAPAGQDLFSHLQAAAGDEQDCRLYDQLGHGGPLPQLPVLAAAVVPAGLAWTVPAVLLAAACAPYAARAPPVSR